MTRRMGSADEPLALNERERCLLPLLLGGTVSAQDMRTLTEGLDIDHTGQEYLFGLARLGCRWGWEMFPPEMVPRLKGIHRYHQASNTLAFPWLLEKIRVLGDAGIPVLLLKGLAIRFFYDPGVPRIMCDYDIAVPGDRFEQAMTLLQDEHSFDLGSNYPHHGRIQGERRCLEVHRWVFKHHGETGSDIWDRAVHFDLFGQDVCVMCPQDMFIHQMDNRARDIFINTFPGRRMQWLYDCRRILATAEAPPDLGKLSARAEQFNVTNSLRYMLPAYAACFPGSFDPEGIRRIFPDTPGYEKWLKSGMKLRRLNIEWQALHYEKDCVITPRFTCWSLRRMYADYRHLRWERRPGERGGGFWQYYYQRHAVSSFGELYAKYKVRLLPFYRQAERGNG